MTSAAPAAGLPLRARPFLVLVLAAAAAIAAPLLLHLGLSTDDWVTFGTLAVGAAAAQLFAVVAPPNQAFYTVIAFLVAAALLLPPQFLPLVAVAQHLPEWLKCRYAWYIQTFNIANYMLDLLGAWAAAHLAAHIVAAGGADPRVSFAVAAVAAVAAFVALNHVLLAMMLRLARVDSFR